MEAATRGIDLIGPLQPGSRRQTRTGQVYAATNFTINWEQHQAHWVDETPRATTRRPHLTRPLAPAA